MIRVERFHGRPAEWDDFARSQTGFTHYHLHSWREVMAEVFGHECIYLAARNPSGALEGILPLVRVKSVVFGHYLVSMPFLNYGGPIGTASGVIALVDEAIELARAGRVKLLELRSRVPLAIDLPVSHRKVTVLLDLERTADAMLKRFDSKLRSQIRRPQRAGITVRFGPNQADPFFDVFSRHMRDLGTPTQPRALFGRIAQAFPDDAWFACAYLDGQAVAAGCGFRFGAEVELAWAAALRRYSRQSPNMLLYWAFMERAIAEGITTFNFGRCTAGGGTYRFKMQWGGQETPLWWYDCARRERAATPSSDDAAYRWGARIWRHLPTRVATALGPGIVRYIP